MLDTTYNIYRHQKSIKKIKNYIKYNYNITQNLYFFTKYVKICKINLSLNLNYLNY
jgi:hypothetical protein